MGETEAQAGCHPHRKNHSRRAAPKAARAMLSGATLTAALTAALTIAVTVALTAAAPARAQGAEEGGLRFGLSLTQEFRSRTNPGLDTPAGASEHLARTRLGLDFVTETRSTRLAFRLDGALEAGRGAENGLVAPGADLSWRSESAAARFEISAFRRETAVDALEFTAGTGPGGDPILIPVAGTGTQRQTGASLQLEVGREAPVGATLSLGLTDTTYLDTTDAGLVDGTRGNARLALRFDLGPATRLTAALAASRLEETGAAASDTGSLSLGLVTDRPDGTLGLDATLTRTDGDAGAGQRESLVVSRRFDLPAGQISLRLGASTTSGGGGAVVVGGIDWAQDLPRGQISLGLDRRVTGNARDAETVVSRLTLALSQDLSPRLSGRLALGLQDSLDTDTEATTGTGDLTAALRYGLTPDWALDLGATHRLRRDEGAATARSTDIFLTLNRRFDWRP